MGLFTRRTANDNDLRILLDRDLTRLFGLAVSMTGNKHDAEDLVQETLAKVIDKWDKVEASANQGAYVRSMLVNTYVSQKRRFASREVISDETVAGRLVAVRDSQDQLTDRHLLRSMVTTLPRKQRAVVALRYYEDLPVKQVAEILDMTEVAVRSSCHKALLTMRERMERPLDEAATGVRTTPAHRSA